jgi:hypothetical protein
MAPLLISALVGIGVKLASDVFMFGAKKFFKQDSSGDLKAGTAGTTTFASTLDKARGATPAGAAAASAAPGAVGMPTPVTAASDSGLADRSKVMAAGVVAPAPSPGQAYALASYRRFDEAQAP